MKYLENRYENALLLKVTSKNNRLAKHTGKNDPENTITECVDAMHSVCSQWFLNGTNHTTVR